MMARAVATLAVSFVIACGGTPNKPAPAAAGGKTSFLGAPLPEACKSEDDPRLVDRCLGFILDRVMVAGFDVLGDSELTAYVSRIGARVAKATGDRDTEWTFRVMDEPAVQAYATVAGYIYVSRGALAHLRSEAELAALLAHEIGLSSRSTRDFSRSTFVSGVTKGAARPG
jgi:hypothetical protein